MTDDATIQYHRKIQSTSFEVRIEVIINLVKCNPSHHLWTVPTQFLRYKNSGNNLTSFMTFYHIFDHHQQIISNKILDCVRKIPNIWYRQWLFNMITNIQPWKSNDLSKKNLRSNYNNIVILSTLRDTQINIKSNEKLDIYFKR